MKELGTLDDYLAECGFILWEIRGKGKNN